MISIHFIINPFSGTRNKEFLVDLLYKSFSQPEYDLEIHWTEYSGHARILAENAVKRDINIVVAIGGDGTINEVAGPLIYTSSKLGVIAMGSGNGFSRHLKIYKSAIQSIKTIKQGKTLTVDTCRINDKTFLNVAGIGFDAKVAYKTKKNKIRGLWHYVKTSLKYAYRFKSIPMTIATTTQEIEGKFKTVVVANGSYYGYNFAIAPNADLCDGLLDVMLFEHAPLWKYALAFPLFITAQIHKASFVKVIKTTYVDILLKHKHHFHVDGEGYKSLQTSYHIDIYPKSLQILTN